MKNIKIIEIKKLLTKKNFEGATLFIENAYTETEKTSEILNILGVCKLQKKLSNNFDLISAIEDFRNCYLKEKKTKQGIEGLTNFIVCSNKIQQYEDSIKYFKEAEKSFGYIQKLFNLMVDVYKNFNNVRGSIHCLKKIIENENIKNCKSAFQRYIYFNNFINHWSQKDFFENSIKIEHTLPQFLEQKKIDTIKNKKIKLAFLSSDIRKNHSVTGFLKTVVSNVNKDKFELIFFFKL